MSKDYCYVCDYNYYHGGHCTLCNKKCDKCNICKNAFNEHNKIFDLSNDFCSKVRASYYDIKQKAKETNEFLNKNNIYINYYSCEDFLSKLRDKDIELENKYKDLGNKIKTEEKEQTRKKNELCISYQNDINIMNQEFQTEKNKYIYKKDRNLIMEKNKIIKNLKKEKLNINDNKKTIITNYIQKERAKADNIFNDKKATIQQEENANKEKDLKYSEEENNLKNEYSKKILKIKEIADKIPCYNNFIIQTGLNKYLN